MRLPRAVRFGMLVLAVVVAGVSIGLYQRHQMYTLSAAELKLIGGSTVDKKFIKDENGKITYNHQDDTTSKSEKTVTLAASKMDATGQAPYRAELAKAHREGITFSDAEQTREFKLIPLFSVSSSRYEDGRVVYPEGSNRKHVYTFRTNGVKEDIILTKPSGDTASYSWKLDLGKELEAKLLSNGDVGIYSANPYLFGDVQVSGDSDQKLIDSARKNSEKTHVSFVLPAPFISEADGTKNYKDVAFKLDGNTLTLEAKNLESKHYPISIDPSVVVTTSADFRTATDDGGINYATANEIRRSVVAGGAVGASTRQAAAFVNDREGLTSVAYDGYVYIMGGSDGGTNYNDIQYCPINSNGSVGTCLTNATGFITPRTEHTSVVYNGYLYIIGGWDKGSEETAIYYSDIQYCPIDSTTHAVGTCTQQTNAFTTARYGHASVVYNGYLYIIGGYGPPFLSDIQYCPLNADGSVGTCLTNATALPATRQDHTAFAYNGYLYVTGGYENAANSSSILYCPINSNGSVGTCLTNATGFTTARYSHTTVVANGYLYIMGGNDGSVWLTDIQNCPIYASGAVGACTQQASHFPNGRTNAASFAYNGYLYIVGGYWGNSVNREDDIQYVPIGTAVFSGGSVGATTRQTNAYTSGRVSHSSFVYSGRLYIVGGGSAPYQNDIQYCPLNANGSVGTCIQQTNAFAIPRAGHEAAAYNGYLYIAGGYDGANYYNDIQYCPINADGSVGACTRQLNAFPTARSGLEAGVYNGYLYIFGGNSSTTYQNDIIYCPLSANGSVGACTQQTAAFTTARNAHASAIYNGYLYIVGGYSGSYQNDIIYCPLNPNGSAGTCVQKTAAFTSIRSGHKVVAYNGYLYIIGGYDGTNFFNDIQYCPLNAANGTVGTCTQQTAAFTTARNGHNSVAWGGYIYIIGGHDGAAYQTDIQYLRTNAPMYAGTYEKTINLGSTGEIESLTYNGTAFCGEDIKYSLAGGSGVYGASTTILDALPGATYVINQDDIRYIRLFIPLDDSTCGGTSAITDITVTYVRSARTPVLSTPVNGVVGSAILPIFTLRSHDAEGDYLRYKIEVCSTSNCSSILRTIDQTASQAGWTGQDQQAGTAYTGNATITSSTMATHTYQAPALTLGTQYWWRAYAIDEGSGGVWSRPSAIRSFTTQNFPGIPVLISPAASSTGVSNQDPLILKATDNDGDGLQYKIELCGDAACTSLLRIIDQTQSQTGWSLQNANGGTAYTSSPVLADSQMAVFTYENPTLMPNTQYWWRAYSIDPLGTNTWSAASSIQTFTTGINLTRVVGGTNITGGTRFGN
ncbi:MAG: hypothetical protein JWP13_952 [Candidatus Saccharibacteria bacterium]|nr:hypothetical protein [Candidatus Saccharibacteria bacterium]